MYRERGGAKGKMGHTANPKRIQQKETLDNKSAPAPKGSDEASETDTEGSNVSGSEEDNTCWISWFCNLRGNEFFCEVDEDYIQDDFNLCGLSSQIQDYDYALDLILDVESSLKECPQETEQKADLAPYKVFFVDRIHFGTCHGKSVAFSLLTEFVAGHAMENPCDSFTEEQNELIESAAEMLYGLIHVRYILTTKGLAAMQEKFKNAEFGRCPKVYCCGQPCLPVGESDIPCQGFVNIYCPKCEDIYLPRSRFHERIDGSYFGTTFPHLFLMTYRHLKPPKTSQKYVPRVFGFKVHKP